MKTTILTPRLPPPWASSGSLYAADNPAELSEDMLDAWLDDGTVISAGWSECGDPHGQYKVRVTRGLSELNPAYLTGSLQDAAQYVETMAAKLTGQPTNGCAPQPAATLHQQF